MKKVSAKSISRMLDITREYYADLWREDEFDKALLDERTGIAKKLEDETGVSFVTWLNFVSAAFCLADDVTDDEAFCALRCLGFEPEVDHD